MQLLYPQVPKGFLKRTCQLESRCKAVGIHRSDRSVEREVWRRAVKRGWLDPVNCVAHRSSVGASTHGSFGLIAAYHVRFLPIPCAPYWLLDYPIFSALAAARKVDRVCTRWKRLGKGYKCWPGQLRVLWAGGNKSRDRVIGRYYGGRKTVNRLREQREKSRLTVDEVSKVTGISQSALTKYENGNLQLSDERAKILAKLYKVETHELFLTLTSEESKAAQ